MHILERGAAGSKLRAWSRLVPVLAREDCPNRTPIPAQPQENDGDVDDLARPLPLPLPLPVALVRGLLGVWT
jgi:hypothetical protein